MHGCPGQPVIKVATQTALFHRLGQIGLAGGKKTRGIFPRFIHHPRDTRLCFQRDIGNFVDQQCAAPHPGQNPRRAFNVLQIRRRYRHKRQGTPVRKIMYCFADQ